MCERFWTLSRYDDHNVKVNADCLGDTLLISIHDFLLDPIELIVIGRGLDHYGLALK